MPLYEFRCPVCGNTFEDLVRRADEEAQVSCPVCGTKGATRLLSAPAIGGSGSASASSGGGGGCGGGHGGFT